MYIVSLWTLYNIIIDYIILASADYYNYNYDYDHTLWNLGKRIQQDLHYRDKLSSFRVYRKYINTNWWDFYKAIHKNPPASEKLVSWIRHGIWSATWQLWAS